ncbi:hypothetical protein RND71_040027 [Anisodus tanguticus]|uniref:Uncharacterized protein n=1 Tax=Anisodus tanguticus TaxID=243964 RepID=A0AAE1QXY0_9SOLA|nr:hypothetical protein RND71_040027 [Anisodus tanguticus]
MSIRAISRLKIPSHTSLFLLKHLSVSRIPSISSNFTLRSPEFSRIPSRDVRFYHDGRPRGPLWRGKKLIGKEALFVILGLKRFKDDEEKVDKFVKTHVLRLLKMDMITVLNELERQEEVSHAVKDHRVYSQCYDDHRVYFKMAIRAISRLKIPSISSLFLLKHLSVSPLPSISSKFTLRGPEFSRIPLRDVRFYHDGRPRGPLWRGKNLIGKEALFVILGLQRFKDDEDKLDKFVKTHVIRLLKMDMIAVLNELERQEEVSLAVKVFWVIQKQAWYQPDVYLYKDLIIALARRRKMDDAMKLWENRSKADLDSLQKADLKTIGFLALKKIEQEATNVSITVRLKLLNNSAQLSSDTQQALSDCNDHFIPAIELIDDAVDATVNGAFNDAINYYTIAITDFEVCYPHLKAMRTSNAVDVNDYVDNHIAEVANARNNLVKFIHIPLDILKVVAASSPH